MSSSIPTVARLGSSGLDVWVYRAADWLVRDLNAPNVAREAFTVRCGPTPVASFDGLTNGVAKIVGVSDDQDLVASVASAARDGFGDHVSVSQSQPYDVDVTRPQANMGVVGFCRRGTESSESRSRRSATCRTTS